MKSSKLLSIAPHTSFFNQFKEEKAQTKDIFARIPLELYDQINDICEIENQSRYEIVRIALTILVKEYESHKNKS